MKKFKCPRKTNSIENKIKKYFTGKIDKSLDFFIMIGAKKDCDLLIEIYKNDKNCIDGYKKISSIYSIYQGETPVEIFKKYKEELQI